MAIECTSDLCEKSCDNYKEWIEHMKEHIHEEIFRCCFCYKCFPKLWRMKRHSDCCDKRTKVVAASIEIIGEVNQCTSNVQSIVDNDSHEHDLSWVPIQFEKNSSARDNLNNQGNTATVQSISDGLFNFLLKLYGKIDLPKSVAQETLWEMNDSVLVPLLNAIQDQKCDSNFVENVSLSLGKVMRKLGSDYTFKNMVKGKNK